MPNYKEAGNLNKKDHANNSTSSFLNRSTRPFTIPEQEIQPQDQTGVEQEPIQKKSNTTGMPDAVLQKMESHFNTDFSDVKIFPDSTSAIELNTRAYTQGNHIHFAPGKYNPVTADGEKILKHELKHVEQQRKGIVEATSHVKGVPLNNDPDLEKQASSA